MAFEETREQQQMYNYFRSCIYIFLIIEIIMNLPVRQTIGLHSSYSTCWHGSGYSISYRDARWPNLYASVLSVLAQRLRSH